MNDFATMHLQEGEKVYYPDKTNKRHLLTVTEIWTNNLGEETSYWNYQKKKGNTEYDSIAQTNIIEERKKDKK